jgi:hypothetical protein
MSDAAALSSGCKRLNKGSQPMSEQLKIFVSHASEYAALAMTLKRSFEALEDHEQLVGGMGDAEGDAGKVCFPGSACENDATRSLGLSRA